MPSYDVMPSYDYLFGYECAKEIIQELSDSEFLIQELSDSEFLIAYFSLIFVNLANPLMIINMLLQFFVPLRKLAGIQFIAVLSSLYWLSDYVRNVSFDNLMIGYWVWVSTITIYLFLMIFDKISVKVKSLKIQKKVRTS